jgi:hypothetical protein
MYSVFSQQLSLAIQRNIAYFTIPAYTLTAGKTYLLISRADSLSNRNTSGTT